MPRTPRNEPMAKIFAAAYRELTPAGIKDGRQKEIVFQTGIPQSTVSGIINGHRPGTEAQRRAIAEAAGFSYEGFMDVGRRKLGLPTSGIEPPPSPETAGYLVKARHILEGPKGAALKVVLDDMGK